MDVAPALFIIGYALVCIMVGVCGHYRRCGFMLSAVLAAILTPPIMLLALYMFSPRGPAPQRPH